MMTMVATEPVALIIPALNVTRDSNMIVSSTTATTSQEPRKKKEKERVNVIELRRSFNHTFHDHVRGTSTCLVHSQYFTVKSNTRYRYNCTCTGNCKLHPSPLLSGTRVSGTRNSYKYSVPVLIIKMSFS